MLYLYERLSKRFTQIKKFKSLFYVLLLHQFSWYMYMIYIYLSFKITNLMPWSANNWRKHGSWSIVAGKSSLAHTGSIVNDQSCYVLVTHFYFLPKFSHNSRCYSFPAKRACAFLLIKHVIKSTLTFTSRFNPDCTLYIEVK